MGPLDRTIVCCDENCDEKKSLSTVIQSAQKLSPLLYLKQMHLAPKKYVKPFFFCSYPLKYPCGCCLFFNFLVKSISLIFNF